MGLELWQLYDEQGRAIPGKGASKDEVFAKGLLHGASHVWIWRKANQGVEVLLQRRAAHKRTWPDKLDISAAGHIDLDETPLTAALREAQEEIGLEINENDLRFVASFHSYAQTNNGDIENEIRWLYLWQCYDNLAKNTLQAAEVDAIEWLSLAEFSRLVLADDTPDFVPHGRMYFETLVQAIHRTASI